jgi:hypothetical protein
MKQKEKKSQELCEKKEKFTAAKTKPNDTFRDQLDT